MASSLNEAIKGARQVVWGSEGIPDDCLRQWRQPFVFSTAEKVSLIQMDGGPCAVLAPVQAQILLQTLLVKGISKTINSVSDLQQAVRVASSSVSPIDVLDTVLCSILCRCASAGSLKIVQIAPKNDENQELHTRMSIKDMPKSALGGTQQIASNFLNEGGVLAFVYSMVLTRGLDLVQSDMGLQMDPLIESVHAHGSVTLTNLCITGRAVPNLFDDSRDLGGLVLQGINETPDVGYLSLMEHYRYIEVGERMKNPRYPVWLLCSETHLTVLCSLEKSLCAASEEANLKRAFAKFDTEGNGFIQETQLPDLMQELGEENDHESVLRVKSEIDSEDLGIITLGAVMQKYLPQSAQLTLQSITGQPGAQGQEFQVMTDIPFIHYNGLHFKQNTNSSSSMTQSETGASISDGSNLGNRDPSLEQSFSYGIGIIGLDAGRLAGAAGVKESKLDLILSTKWPAINISWNLGPQPSVDWSS